MGADQVAAIRPAIAELEDDLRARGASALVHNFDWTVRQGHYSRTYPYGL
jgi:hypothetical protein